MITHGGNLRAASENFNIQQNKIIDFSSNINPLGYHPLIKKAIISNIKTIMSYPDPDYKKLLESISSFYNIDKKNLILGNGSTELIYLLSYTLKPVKAVIIQPSYIEYELSLNKINSKILNLVGKNKDNFKVGIHHIINKLKDKNINIIYLSNPNNPSGYIYTKEELEELLSACKKYKKYLFIDEAFLDFLPDYNDITLSSYIEKNKHLIILKTLTKFYAIPGLRLGLIAASKSIIEKLKFMQPPWSINCFSQLIGDLILNDRTYIEKTISYIKEEKYHLIIELSKIKGIKVFLSYTNYILCEITNSKKLVSLENYLSKKNIIIRNCSNYIGLNDKYFRVAVKTRKENKLLLKCLKEFFK